MTATCRFCADHDGLPHEAGNSPGERSAAYNRTIIFHEYAHGVSVRLVGGGVTGCLDLAQSGALGEGWSDIFPASFYDAPETFKYLYEGTGFSRHLSHDLTYDQFCEVYGSACQVHADSLIWTGALWELRRSMIAIDPAQGLDKFHRIVLEGIASTPCDPDYLDARDAILAADQALYGSAHRTSIWNAFASRGMGSGASSHRRHRHRAGHELLRSAAGLVRGAGRSCRADCGPGRGQSDPTELLRRGGAGRRGLAR